MNDIERLRLRRRDAIEGWLSVAGVVIMLVLLNVCVLMLVSAANDDPELAPTPTAVTP